MLVELAYHDIQDKNHQFLRFRVIDFCECEFEGDKMDLKVNKNDMCTRQFVVIEFENNHGIHYQKDMKNFN